MDIIKELKENWTAWGGLSEEKREFLKANRVDAWYYSQNDEEYIPLDEHDEIVPHDILRLRPDFEEKKRWFFDLKTYEAYSASRAGETLKALEKSTSRGNCIEVREEDLPYLEKPDGEWEFLKVSQGCEYISYNMRNIAVCSSGHHVYLSHLQGYRWCKAKAESEPQDVLCSTSDPQGGEEAGRWAEYPIYPDHGVYFCRVDHMNKCGAPKSPEFTLSDLPDFVGFGGVQFEEQDDPDNWYHLVSGSFTGVDWPTDVPSGDDKPATPIKARFWV